MKKYWEIICISILIVAIIGSYYIKKQQWLPKMIDPLKLKRSAETRKKSKILSFKQVIRVMNFIICCTYQRMVPRIQIISLF